MKPVTYKITRGEHGNPEQFHEVSGFLMFELFGYEWAAHKDVNTECDGIFEHWIVSEVSTGFELVSGKILFNPEQAKEWAWKYLLDKGEPMTRFHLNQAKLKLASHDLQEMREG